MRAPQHPVPDVPLKTFVVRQWWALAAGLVGVVVVGAFAVGLYAVALLSSSVWFYASLALLLVFAKPLLLRRADGLVTSRKRRMMKVLTMTGTACLVGVVVNFVWHQVASVSGGFGFSWPNWQGLCWLVGPVLLVAAVHVLSAWVVEWAGGHTAARRLGIPS